jgi:hypothetical protein
MDGRATDVRRLRQAVVVQLRRLEEHNAKPCDYAGGNGPCPFAAREQTRLVELWNELRALGDDAPEDIRP